MQKLLKVGHIAVVVVMAVYCGLVLEQLAAKLLNPESEDLKFWKPGPEVGVVAVALVALLGMLGCSTGLLKPRTWRLPAILHGIWLACLTWFGWFSIRAPFRLQELVRVDLDDPGAVRVAVMLHTAQAMSVYVAIVTLTSIPLLMALIRRGRGDSRHGQVV